MRKDSADTPACRTCRRSGAIANPWISPCTKPRKKPVQNALPRERLARPFVRGFGGRRQVEKIMLKQQAKAKYNQPKIISL
jgi:hypothetical protein